MKSIFLFVLFFIISGCKTDENWRTTKTRSGNDTYTNSVYDPKPEDLDTRNRNKTHTKDTVWIPGYRFGAGTDNEGDWIYGNWYKKTPEIAKQNLQAEGQRNSSKQMKTSLGNWSEFLGETNDWYAAQKKCSSMKMRLPTIKELKSAFEEGIIKPGIYRTGAYYWSSTRAAKTEYGPPDNILVMGADYGELGGELPARYSLFNSYFRCIR